MVYDGMRLFINTLYSSKFTNNLISFRDIYHNGYHIKTISEDNIKYLCITFIAPCQKHVLEKLFVLSFRLYYIFVVVIKANVILNQKFNSLKNFFFWHNQLGHPGLIIMQRIIENINGHIFKN